MMTAMTMKRARALTPMTTDAIRRTRGCLRDERGQMTVELCMLIPVAIIIAVIVVNAATFIGCCAEFDRISRNAVRIHATSPTYGQAAGDSSAFVLSDLNAAFADANLECDVSVTSDYMGFATYEMTLGYHPTLFGMGLRSEVLGVSLPPLKHTSRLTVYPYKPGVLF